MLVTVKYPTTPSTTIRCISTGSPIPIVTWCKDNNCMLCEEGPAVVPAEGFPPPNTILSNRCITNSLLGYSELVIANPRVEDEGMYTCIAENVVATTTSSVYLQVEGKVVQCGVNGYYGLIIIMIVLLKTYWTC